VSISSLTDRILADAENEAARIEAAAQGEAVQIKAAADKRGETLKEEFIAAERQRLEQEKKGRLAAAELAARDKVIEAKQTTIDTVFSMARDRYNELDQDAYIELAARLIAKNAVGGEEVVFDDLAAPTVREEIVAGANRALTVDGCDPVSVAPDTRKIGSGFVLRRDRVEVNFAFGLMLARSRERLEPEVAKMIFTGGDE